MRTIISVLATGSLFLVPLLVHAETVHAEPAPTAPTLIISEVAWAGSTASDADEWIELANIGSTPIDITGYTLEGATGTTPFVFPALRLEPGITFVLSNYAAGNEKSILITQPKVVSSSVSLSNTGLHLVLKDSAGFVLDQVSGNTIGTSGAIRASMERDLNSQSLWRTATTADGIRMTGHDFGTPGTVVLPSHDEPQPVIPTVLQPESESITTPDTAIALPQSETLSDSQLDHDSVLELAQPLTQSYAAITPPIDPPGIRFHDIIINEFDASEEWVEYRNQTSNDLNTEGLTLEDAGGRQFALTGILTAHSYGVLRLRAGTLNNDGDVVRLRTADGTVIDQVGYGKQGRAPSQGKGQTISRFRVSEESELDFEVSDTPTPGAQNIVEEPKVELNHTDANTPSLSTGADATRPQKSVTYKLTITGQTSLYVHQANTFAAVITPLRQTYGPISWYADGERITEGISTDGHRLIYAFPEPGIHILTAISGSDSGDVQSSRTYTVRSAPVSKPSATNTAETPGTTTLAIASTPGATAQAKRNPTASTSGRGKSVGILPSLSGTVVAGERLLGVRKFLLDTGIAVTLKAGKLPALAPGDTVTVRGKYTTSRTTFTAATSKDIRVTGHHTKTKAHMLSAEDDREVFTNRLVSVSGTVGHIQGKQFVLLGDEDTQVYWKAGASLPMGLVQQGAKIAVTGILTLKSNEWTLLPRGAEDIQILEPAPVLSVDQRMTGAAFNAGELATTGSVVAGGALAVLMGLLGAHAVQRRMKKHTGIQAASSYLSELTP